MEDSAAGITYKFTSKHDERKYAGVVSCLDVATVGEWVAAAAAEVLYQSSINFAVDAKMLCAFLQQCPLSLAVEPGKYIKRLHLYMDEDPKFIGDGKDGQGLRKADWVDLESDVGDERVTRSAHRTRLMRQCWRAILNMPKLNRIEFWIMPKQGMVPEQDIQRWEIRDIIPTHVRLFCKRVLTSVRLRTREHHLGVTRTLDWYFDRWDGRIVVDDDGFYESYMCLDAYIPYDWRKLNDKARVLAESILAGEDPLGSPSSFYRHQVLNYDALRDLLARMHADKDYEFTRNGKTRRTQKHSSDDTTIEADGQTKRKCRS